MKFLKRILDNIPVQKLYVPSDLSEPPDDFNPDLCGWLDRSGRFFKCGFAKHDSYATEVLKMSITEVEDAGYVRADGNGQYQFSPMSYTRSGLGDLRLTMEQHMWLTSNGFEILHECECD